MKGLLQSICLLGFCLVIGVGPAFGSGFGIYEWSARGNAMGGAVVASPKGADTLAANPAAMTDLEGTQTMVGFSAIHPLAEVDMKQYNDGTAKSNTWVPPHAYVTHQWNDDIWLGMGMFSRFGLGTEWDEEWAGRYNVTEASMETFSFNPNLAYRLTDRFTVAVGAEVMWMEFLQRKTVDHNPVPALNPYNPNTYNTDTDAKLLGDSTAVGLTLSMYHKPLDWLRVGVTYRSQIKHKIKGDVNFRRQGSDTPMAAAFPLGAYDTNTSAEGVIILPDSIVGGVSVTPLDGLTVEADLMWTRWSTYQELRVEYGQRLIPTVATSDHSVSVKNWRDTWRYQFGVEYELLDWMDIRAGYVYDQSPIRDDHDDYMLPTNDRQLYCTGLGLRYDSWTLDLSYIYLRSKEREYVFRGAGVGVQAGTAHDLETHIAGLSLGYAF